MCSFKSYSFLMVQIVINMLIMTGVLWLIDSQLLENNKNRNIIMFALTTVVCLALGSFIAFTMKFSSTGIAAVILIPLSFLFGLWVGFNRTIKNLFS